MITPIADMIEAMLADSIPMKAIILAVRTVELASGGQSTRHPPDTRADRRRAWDREYRKNKRLAAKSSPPGSPPDIHPTPDATLSLSREERSLQGEVLVKEESKKEEKKSRATKLPPDWQPKPSHFEYGRRYGLSEHDVLDRAEAMRDWAAANSNRSITTKSDWDRAFNPWLRGNSNGRGTNGIRANPGAGPKPSDQSGFIAGLGKGALRVLNESAATRRAGQLSDSADAAGGLGAHRGAKDGH